MKEKLQNYINAAHIIEQLPKSDAKSRAIENLFGKDLEELGLSNTNYVYGDSRIDGLRIRSLRIDYGESDGLFGFIRVIDGPNNTQTMSVVG